MSDSSSRALRLADEVEVSSSSMIRNEAATELRRLHHCLSALVATQNKTMETGFGNPTNYDLLAKEWAVNWSEARLILEAK